MESNMNKTDFTDLTREELIERIVNMYDPEICQHERIIGLVNADKENEENMFSLKIREGKHYVAKFDWSYYNETDFKELVWEQVTKEKFRQYLYDSLVARTLNELRLKFQVARKDRILIEENEETEKDYIRAMNLVKKLDITMTSRINKTSDIPGDFVCVGNVLDNLDATFLEEHKIDPDILIWQNEKDFLMLTVAVDKDSAHIETLALVNYFDTYIFKKELEEGLEAALTKLSETLPKNEVE